MKDEQQKPRYVDKLPKNFEGASCKSILFKCPLDNDGKEYEFCMGLTCKYNTNGDNDTGCEHPDLKIRNVIRIDYQKFPPVDLI
jgi:hypothetical protein